MERIRFYVNDSKPHAIAACGRLAAAARALGLAVTDDASAQVVVALGGDGTMLRAVREFSGVPVLGLNLGGLGYLASVEERDFGKALEMLAQGRYRISERTMLAVGKRGDAARHEALNDVVIVREMSGHAAILDLEVDGRTATRYMADGLIFATPTGSTAYSLAAGGPVLMPDSGSFVVTPMNPHALGVRPMVVRDAAVHVVTARARAEGAAERLGVYADGAAVLQLASGESVEVAKSARSAALVELDGYDPYEVLARKLGWSGTSVR